jgi:hypothetical protein
MADWREELEARIARTSVRFETDGIDAAEFEALSVEVRFFREACDALADSIRPRRKDAT